MRRTCKNDSDDFKGSLSHDLWTVCSKIARSRLPDFPRFCFSAELCLLSMLIICILKQHSIEDISRHTKHSDSNSRYELPVDMNKRRHLQSSTIIMKQRKNNTITLTFYSEPRRRWNAHPWPTRVCKITLTEVMYPRCMLSTSAGRFLSLLSRARFAIE